jgi:hypothetical protein
LSRQSSRRRDGSHEHEQREHEGGDHEEAQTGRGAAGTQQLRGRDGARMGPRRREPRAAEVRRRNLDPTPGNGSLFAHRLFAGRPRDAHRRSRRRRRVRRSWCIGAYGRRRWRSRRRRRGRRAAQAWASSSAAARASGSSWSPRSRPASRMRARMRLPSRRQSGLRTTLRADASTSALHASSAAGWLLAERAPSPGCNRS